MRKVIVFAALPWLSIATVIACEKTSDDGDAATDAGVVFDRTAADFSVPDTAQPMPAAFEDQVATAFCARMAKCCGSYDGSTFDLTACTNTVKVQGWEGLNAGLAVPGVKNGGHVSVDMMNANACLAGLTVLSCPTIGSMEMKNVTLACRNAILGTQTTGGACLASIECKPTDICVVGPDGGTGTCTTSVDAGVPRADDAICAGDLECQSGICFQNDAGPNCTNNGCSCKQDLDWRQRICGLPFPPPPPDPDASVDASPD